MLEQWLKSPYQKILIAPIVGAINSKVSPIQVTLLAAILGLLFMPSLLMGYSALAIIFLLLSGYCDSLDGSLARYQENATPLGSVLDITLDRVVEFAVIFTLYLQHPIHNGLGAILMLGSILLCMTSFLVVGIFSIKESEKSFYYSAGIMERAEAFLFFIAMVLWPQHFDLLAYLFSALVCLTAVIRLIEFVKSQTKFNPT